MYRFIPMLLFIPVGIYYYFFFKRVTNVLYIKQSFLVRLLLVFLSFLIVYLCSNVFSVWVVIFMHFFAFSLITDIVVFILKRIKKYTDAFNKIYLIGIIPLVLTSLAMAYAYYNMNDIVEKDYTIYTDKKLSEDYKVVLISDLHFSTTMDEKKLEKISNEIEDLNPSMVILAGDIVDENTSKKQMENAFSILGNIKSKYGVFFVYGNHDKSKYYGNRNYKVEDLEQAIANARITELVDTTYEINDDLILIGRDDISFPKEMVRKTSTELVKGLDHNKFLLLIDHHPYDLKENSINEIDLQLSGHTHGGQIFPTGIFTELFNKDTVNYGYRKIDYLNVIVSSGLGGWAYPLRTGTNSEYVVVTITNKQL